MPDATSDAFRDAGFGHADLTTFRRLDELGLEVTGQRIEHDHAVLACRVVEPDGSDGRWWRRCGCEGSVRDTVTWRLAHEPGVETGEFTDSAVASCPGRLDGW